LPGCCSYRRRGGTPARSHRRGFLCCFCAHALQAKDLQLHLETTLTSAPVDVILGHKVVEVRARGASTAACLLHIIDDYLRGSRAPGAADNSEDAATAGRLPFEFVACLTDFKDSTGLCRAVASLDSAGGAIDLEGRAVPLTDASSTTAYMCAVGDGVAATTAAPAAVSYAVPAQESVLPLLQKLVAAAGSKGGAQPPRGAPQTTAAAAAPEGIM
jgi:hypothetical protein